MGLKAPRHHAVAVSLIERPTVKMAKNRIRITEGMRLKLFALWIIMSAGMSKLIYLCMKADNMERRKEVLVNMCDERARMLQDQFAISVNHVHALAILVSTFHHHQSPSSIDQETFALYTARTAFERPLFTGVSYAERVVHSQREWFEKKQGWTIKTMKREPSPAQDEYAPVIFSQETVSYIESLDMMSGEEDRENIVRARATGKAVLTRPFRLLGSNHLGVVLTFPVYASVLPRDATVKDRISATVGYIGGAFDVESLVENLLRKLAGNWAIIVNVYDVTNASMPLIMYGPPHSDGGFSLSCVSMLDFGDPFRRHQMRCRYLESPPTAWSAIGASAGIFVIAILVGYILYAAVSHIAKVEEDFRKMEELKVQAEAADIAKSQFLATVSHEIRTPMNGVLGMLAMLLDTNLNSTQKDYAQTAQTCGKVLITLINEVLDRAKIEAGKLELEAVPFDLRSIMDDVLSVFSGKSRNKGIELAVFVSDKVPATLIGDPGRFRQIITNLVGNSVKFTEQGHIFVQVHVVANPKCMNVIRKEPFCKNETTEKEILSSIHHLNTLSGFIAADDRNCWEIFKQFQSDGENFHDTFDTMHISNETSDSVSLMVSVEDTGTGIPLHAQDRVFTPFMQADSSTSRNYGGTGIGLSISKCLVELMGGEINFLSRPDFGSTFMFTVVFKRAIRTENSDTKETLSESLYNVFKGMEAIVVDGRPVRAAVTKYHLRRLGFTVEIVNSIKAAYDLLSGQNSFFGHGVKKRVNVILVEKDSWISYRDSSMSESVFDRNHCMKRFDVLKMVLMATSVTTAESDETRMFGFSDTIILKPLRASTLAVCLQQVLGIGKKPKTGEELRSSSSKLHSLLLGKRILVVDDNSVNRRVAAGALKKYGVHVECAESGKAALSLLKLPHHFDACFMDIQMPEMDGFEATRQIRLMEKSVFGQIENGESLVKGNPQIGHCHVPILAMTADVIQATYEECVKCGMDGYVSKPFDEEQLYQAVAKFFSSKPL